MVDMLTREQRSERMSKIPSANTKPEIAIRKALHAMGLRFTLGNKQLPGKPDLVFPRYKTALFVHGCFWHRHVGCKVATTPKSNSDFWIDKFNMNVERDKATILALEKMGWKVSVVWECELHPKKISICALALYTTITSKAHKSA